MADARPMVVADAHSGGRVLFVRAEAASDAFASSLRDRGWWVDEVVAYRTVSAPSPDALTARAVAGADAVTFASPSAVTGFLAMRDAASAPLIVPPVVVCIGETTARAAQGEGLDGVVVSPSPATLDIVATVLGHLRPGAADHRSSVHVGDPR